MSTIDEVDSIEAELRVYAEENGNDSALLAIADRLKGLSLSLYFDNENDYWRDQLA